MVTDPFVPLPGEIPVITVENISASMQVMEHLLSLGHRRIAIITGPAHWGMTIDRTAGYYASLASAGIPIDPSLICEGRWTAASGEEVGYHLLSLPEPPTAIFAFNDDMASGVMHALLKRGLRVPEDISVVGFDDVSPNLPHLSPALTTVHHPLVEIGRLAVDVLYRLLRHQPLEATHITLSARLVVRNSTARCRGEVPLLKGTTTPSSSWRTRSGAPLRRRRRRNGANICAIAASRALRCCRLPFCLSCTTIVPRIPISFLFSVIPKSRDAEYFLSSDDARRRPLAD